MPVSKPCSECGGLRNDGQPAGLCPLCALQGLVRDTHRHPEPTERIDSFGAGTRLGDYDLLEEVGSGGMGVVYKAWQRSLNRVIAIKVVHLRPQTDSSLLRRFRAEAVAAGSLRHPHIVTIHDVGIHEGRPFLAMDFVPGESLAVLARDQALPARQVAEWMKVIAEAIEHAHNRGILHRDLKPSNVMIDTSGQARILDFGLARRLDEDSSLTISGQVVGSPNYMAPEQASGKRHAVRRTTDVYGLGAILYHLLTGRPPAQGATLLETLHQVLHGEPPAPSLIRPGIPLELETICLKCLSKEPEPRYATAQLLADDLARYLRDEPIQARPTGTTEKVWRWCRRKPALAASLFLAWALLLTLSIGGPLAVIRIRQEQRVAEENLYTSFIHDANQQVRDGNLRAASELLTQIAQSPRQSDLRGWEWRYLTARCGGRQMAVLSGHTSFVATVRFSPTDPWLASIDEGGHLILWNWKERKPVASWIAHTPVEHQDTRPWIRCHDTAFSHNGRWLATGGRDGFVRIWDVQSRREVFALKTPRGAVSSLEFSSDDARLLTAVTDSQLTLWDLVSPDGPRILARWPSDTAWIFQAFFTRRDAEVIAIGNRSLSTWNLSDPTHPRRVADWTEASDAIAISQDQEWVLNLSSGSDRLRLWKTSTSSLVKEFQSSPSPIACVSYAPDGARLASGSSEGCLTLWDMDSGKEQVRLPGHLGEVRSIAWSPQEDVIATAGTDRTLRLWDVSPASIQEPELRHGSKVQGLAFLDDGHSLLSVGQASPRDAGHSVVRLWDVATGRNLASHALAGKPIHNVISVSASERQVTVGDMARSHEGVADRVCILELPSLTPLNAWDSQAAAFASRTETLVFARDRELFLRRSRDSVPQRVGTADGMISKLDVSPDGLLAAVRSETHLQEFEFWPLVPGSFPTPIRGHEGSIQELRFSPDGRLLATASWDHSVGLWDVRSRTLRKHLRGHRSNVNCVCFSPDGQRIASGSCDGTVRLWDLRTLRELAVLDAHPTGVWAVAFSPDGQKLAAGSWEGGIRLWHAPQLARLTSMGQPASDAPAPYAQPE